MQDTTPAPNWDLLALGRFLLAGIVLCSHYYVPQSTAAAIAQLGGRPSVLGFLLISGFSIAASLAARPTGFLLRRVLRIYPMYLGALLLTLAVQALAGSSVTVGHVQVQPAGLPTVVGNFLLVQEYLVPSLQFNAPVWSLSIECSYYLLAPLLLLLPRVAIGGLVLVSALAYASPALVGAGWSGSRLVQLDGLQYLWIWLLGFLLFSFRRPPFVLLAALVSLVLLRLNARDYANVLNFVPVLLALALLGFSGRVTLAPRVGKFCAFLGDLSYPLYLVHFPLAVLLLGVLGVRSELLYVASSLAMACLLLLTFDGWIKRRILRPLLERRAMSLTNPATAIWTRTRSDA